MNRKHCSMTTEKRTYPFAHTSDPMQVNIWLEHKIQVGYSENADSELHCFISPPVGRRMGRRKSVARFQNKADAKKPDSRKNQTFLELLARFPQGTKPLRGCRELATSSLPTALEYKNPCIPAILNCFLW